MPQSSRMMVTRCAWVSQRATSGLAVYLRAHKQEPFMGLSILSACCVVAGVAGFGRFWGPTGASFGYFVATALIALPAAAIIFRRKKAEWHAVT